MSDVIESVDLTLFGCPTHHIKARESLSVMALEQSILFIVNNGDAVTKVLNNLRQDGQLCEIELEQNLTTTIKVTKKV